MVAEFESDLTYLVYGPRLPTPLTRQALASALRRLRHEARLGDMDAQVAIGTLFRTGTVLRKNNRAAVRWYKRAMRQGHVDAMCLAALVYLSRGDVAEGHALLCAGAARGSSYALCVLGHLHMRGDVVDKDESLAIDNFMKAASMGNASAEAALGYIYRRGLGVPKDEAAARRWYARAARHGHAKAQYIRARKYLSRVRSRRQLVMVYAWALRSSRGGDPVARKMAERLRTHLTAEDCRRAEKHLARRLV